LSNGGITTCDQGIALVLSFSSCKRSTLQLNVRLYVSDATESIL
jgi:hypothetical protein